jgi:hypothetical protein
VVREREVQHNELPREFGRQVLPAAHDERDIRVAPAVSQRVLHCPHEHGVRVVQEGVEVPEEHEAHLRQLLQELDVLQRIARPPAASRSRFGVLIRVQP